MKLFSILTAGFILLSNFKVSSKELHDRAILEKRIIEILVDLDSVITSASVKNDMVEQHFNFIKNKLFTKELSFVYDTSLNYGFSGCASFNVALKDNQDVNISLGPYILDKYKAHPFLVYAILIHVFQYAYDYYNNQDLFKISLDNPIEKTYFAIDALMLEALFLKTYVNDPKRLGYVERYLIMDLQNSLKGSAALFEETDLDLLHQVDNLKSQNKSSGKILNEFSEIGQDLIKNTDFRNKSDWEKYCAIVRLKTYVYYSRQVIFDIVHLKEGIEPDAFSMENYPENIKIIKDIQGIIGKNIEYLSYRENTINLYAKYYER